jgi:hypothetical protein
MSNFETATLWLLNVGRTRLVCPYTCDISADWAYLFVSHFVFATSHFLSTRSFFHYCLQFFVMTPLNGKLTSSVSREGVCRDHQHGLLTSLRLLYWTWRKEQMWLEETGEYRFDSNDTPFFRMCLFRSATIVSKHRVSV